MVSGSDDFTMFLWNPAKEKKSIARLTGKYFAYLFSFSYSETTLNERLSYLNAL